MKPYLGLAAFLIVFGAAAPNPGFRFVLFLLAALAALPALRVPNRRPMALAILALTAALAAASYPAFDRHLSGYRQRAVSPR